jgi:2-polyprenyl-6-methoxyphenol hydroxylase-like FAD-dependent oxidoreductase
MMQSQAPIAIVGAGPAGLTLARLLEVAEIPYVVFERDVSATWANEHQSSGTLDLHPTTGQAALLEAGLFPRFQSLARFGVPLTIVDSQGKVHVSHSREGDTEEPEIDRKDLRDLLLSSVPASRILWDHKIQRIEIVDNGSVTTHFENQPSRSGFRLVVGADGAWSKIRATVSKVSNFDMASVEVPDSWLITPLS